MGEAMKSYPSAEACMVLLFGTCMVGVVTATNPYQKPGFFDFDSWFWNTPRGPQMFACITYMEKNLQIDCEFPETQKIPGPFCEFKQDGRLMGSTYPNTPVHMIPPIETRRRTNVSLVQPNICRLTWMPLSDDRAYSYTCRVYQGSTWKENSMAYHQRNLLVCSALSILFHTGPWIHGVVISLSVSLGLL
ncbi:uncharacterized protein si:ch211-215c18.3 isoform X2 [Xyrauchen texanus]|uniref:uncharacterized protein si:ch211-215c18.3 isoform X2 n=1 Tax=Xyrauchen texanus TaxID=154827 RepID=UPI0022429338|nr:uncharacterized protein si:ch211-215c18.3 isoform X2 [Xyrauchen texanus]XP_051965800.1 uncharacterized protein si:ch211-215c18.3 isoform X2 [Xyrauchen texanus]